MEKIKSLNFEENDLDKYEEECFIEIKKDKTIYGLLLDNGFSDETIKQNIGSCHAFYVDYYRWQNIKTYDDVLKTGEKYNYKLIYDGQTIVHVRGILKPYRDYMDYVSRFIVKDFSDDFNNVRLKDIDNRVLKNKIGNELKNGHWAYITGAMRSGRTYCTIAFLNGSASKGNSELAFLDSAKEIKNLNDLYFKNKSEFNKKMYELENAHMLVLDGFGNEYVNEIIRDMIVIPLLQERAANNRVTMFTSDFPLNDLIMLYSTKDKSGNNIRVKQLSNILHSMIKEEIVSSNTSLY